jgi:hypothetical protein
LPTDPRATAEAWTLAFANRDGIGGFVRLVRWTDRCWYWAYVVAPGWGIVTVRDHEVRRPPRRDVLVVRADGLWAELVPETPGEHWSVGLEAFGVRLDDPFDAERGERGERLPVGLDLEWETEIGMFGTVRGELLVADARVAFEGTGTFEHWSFVGDPWAEAWRRLVFQADQGRGDVVVDDAVDLDVDDEGLPTRVYAGPRAFHAEAVAIVPVGGGVILALVRGDAGAGWLEWCRPARLPTL